MTVANLFSRAAASGDGPSSAALAAGSADALPTKTPRSRLYFEARRLAPTKTGTLRVCWGRSS